MVLIIVRTYLKAPLCKGSSCVAGEGLARPCFSVLLSPFRSVCALRCGRPLVSPTVLDETMKFIQTTVVEGLALTVFVIGRNRFVS